MRREYITTIDMISNTKDGTMNGERFQGWLLTKPRTEPATSTPAFVMCPIALQPLAGTPCTWEQVYRMAYEQAQAVVRPSIIERLSASLAN